MNDLKELENRSIYIIREVARNFGNEKIASLWSMGKDSTTLMWLIRKAFMGAVPFPVVHIDTTYKFDVMYDFRNKMAAEWNLDLRIVKNEEALAAGMNKDKGRLTCCNALKTQSFQLAVDKYDLSAVFLAIRRDEHGVRAKERYMSPRDKDFKWDYENQPTEMWDQYQQEVPDETHFRVHPMLDWTELDIWRYIKQENIPTINMYFAKQGKRYRSIGCHPCTNPVPSEAMTVDQIIAELESTNVSERAGRAQDKESAATMQKLRSLGYM